MCLICSKANILTIYLKGSTLTECYTYREGSDSCRECITSVCLGLADCQLSILCNRCHAVLIFNCKCCSSCSYFCCRTGDIACRLRGCSTSHRYLLKRISFNCLILLGYFKLMAYFSVLKLQNILACFCILCKRILNR